MGRLEKVKGVHILINAFEKVCKQCQNVKLTVVGDGTEKRNLEEQAKELIKNEKINFVGRQSNVIDWVDKSNIFIYPSIWEEGFGISVIEAMARGLIPITFKKGGLIEIIKNEENGFLVNEVNEESLANAIIKVIKLSEEEKLKIAENAKNVAKKFTIERTIQSLKKVYSDLD